MRGGNDKGLDLFVNLDPGIPQRGVRAATQIPARMVVDAGWERDRRADWVFNNSTKTPPAACKQCGGPRPMCSGYCSDICERAAFKAYIGKRKQK